MFVSAVIVGIVAGLYRRRLFESKIPPAAKMDTLNVLASWIVSNALVALLFAWGNRLSASHFLTIPAATGVIAMFYYVAMGGRVDVFRNKILPRG